MSVMIFFTWKIHLFFWLWTEATYVHVTQDPVQSNFVERFGSMLMKI